jgi:mono/diheme cytochrome c family protein
MRPRIRPHSAAVTLTAAFALTGVANAAETAPAPAPAPAPADAPTYNKHIAPILWKNCAGCHRPGEVGPFSLLGYKDAAKRADFLKTVTATRRMPPWKAEPGFGEFHDERRLSDAEIALIARWADAGAPEGDPADLPAAPKFPDGWQLGTPDLVVKMAKPFTVPAAGRDVYRCFVIPLNLDEDRYVTAVEFRPGNRTVVHHVLMFLDANGAARKKDPAGDGYTSFGGAGIVPTGGLGAWVPGASPRFLPEGVGRFVRKGSDLVIQVHYHPSGKEEADQSTVGLYFAKKPSEKIVGGLAVRGRLRIIPAGEKTHRVSGEGEPLPVDVDVLSVAPHMHMIGKEMKVVAATPDGKTVPLIHIADWDFNWQGSYSYAKPVRLPKGTVVKLEAVYDNSDGNPRNPSHPPKPVHWGEQTTDEMCLLGLNVTCDSLADLRKINAMRSGGLARALGGGGIPEEGEGESDADAAKALESVPAEGVAIPEQYARLLGRFDKNGDGRLSREEIAAMPGVLRKRVLDYIAKNRPAK